MVKIKISYNSIITISMEMVQNELFITEENKPNSPVAVYSYDANNIKVLYQAQSDSDIPRAVFYKNQTIWIHTQEKRY